MPDGAGQKFEQIELPEKDALKYDLKTEQRNDENFDDNLSPKKS
jgi:hypothetical protein